MPQTFLQDLRVAGRLLRKSPVFTLTAALSLAIGIGSTTAIFSLVNALLFKSRPGIANPARLVDVGRTGHGRGGFDTSSYPNFVDLRDRATLLNGLAAYRVEPIAMSLRDGREPQPLYVSMVSESFFDVLGTRAVAGRLLARGDDERARQQPVMVLSDGVWERLYHRDRSVVGRSVIVNGVETTIIGVAEPGFRGANFMAADAWVPVGMFPVVNPGSAGMLTNRSAVWLILVGRLTDGVTINAAQAELSTIASQLERSYPASNAGMSWRVVPSALLPARFQGPVTAFLAMLMTIVGLVLLIACVNLAGVLLARGVARTREIAVRVAIGASRARVVRQLVVETLLVFAIGCAAGLVLAYWIVGALAATTASLPVPVAVDLALDRTVILFAIAVTLISGTLSGLVPALATTRADLVTGLKADAGQPAGRRLRLRGTLLVAQVALSCLLLVMAAVVARSLQRAGSQDPGFDARGVDVVSLDLSMGGYRDARAIEFVRELRDRMSRLPGVGDVALARVLPFAGVMSLGAIAAPGKDFERDAIDADWNVVTPGYFRALRVAELEGRDFTDADREGRPAVAVVNETFAKRLRADGNVVGQHVVRRTPGGTSELEIVGVVRDGQYRFVGEAPRPFIWIPFAQEPMDRMEMLVRAAPGATSGIINGVRGVLSNLDPNLPIIKAQHLRDVVSLGLLPQQIAAELSATLGLVGLLLAAFGIYGVTAFNVAQRSREIGVRLALGAEAGQVVRLVVRQGFTLALAGTMAGLLMGVIAARAIASQLFTSSAVDVPAIALVGLVLLAAAAVASYLPARFASRIDPLRALRVD